MLTKVYWIGREVGIKVDVSLALYFYCFLVQVLIGGAFRKHYKIGLSSTKVANSGVRLPVNQLS